jgi:hypothetical protein
MKHCDRCRIEPFDFEINIGTTVAIDNFKQKTGQLRCVKYFLRIAILKHTASLTQRPKGIFGWNCGHEFVQIPLVFRFAWAFQLKQIHVAKRSTIRTNHALLCHEIIDRKLLVLE